jgi:hypothetical protein
MRHSNIVRSRTKRIKPRQQQSKNRLRVAEKKIKRTEPNLNVGIATKRGIFPANVQRKRKTRSLRTAKD